MTWHGVYLHGFASGPGTAKGVALGRRLAGCLASYTIPDLEGGDFRGLTMDGILDRAEAALAALPADGGRVLLIGSSLGGYTAAHLAATGRARRATALLLIAPALIQPADQRRGVVGMPQQGMGDQEAAAGAPGVGAIAPLLAHLGHIGPVHHRERQAEALGHLLLPLPQH